MLEFSYVDWSIPEIMGPENQITVSILDLKIQAIKKTIFKTTFIAAFSFLQQDY